MKTSTPAIIFITASIFFIIVLISTIMFPAVFITLIFLMNLSSSIAVITADFIYVNIPKKGFGSYSWGKCEEDVGKQTVVLK